MAALFQSIRNNRRLTFPTTKPVPVIKRNVLLFIGFLLQFSRVGFWLYVLMYTDTLFQEEVMMPKKRKSKSRAKKSASRKPVRKKALKKKAIKKKIAVRKKSVKKKTVRKKVAKKKATRGITTKKKAPRKSAAKRKGPLRAKPGALSKPTMVEPGAPPSGIPPVEEPAANEEAIGTVTHYYSHLNVTVIQINKGTLKPGDLIHIKGHTTDFTQRVESMEYEHQPVLQAGPGQSVGIKVVDHAREHDIVYLVK
jgi:hypothetical protein